MKYAPSTAEIQTAIEKWETTLAELDGIDREISRLEAKIRSKKDQPET
jgi:hypothetical protein